MSNVLRLAIVDPNDGERESLKNMLLGMDMIWLEAECSRYEFFSDVVAQTSPDIGLVAIDSDPQKALELVGRLGASSPNCAVLVLSSSNDGALILQALRAGAKEFLTQPLRIEDGTFATPRTSAIVSASTQSPFSFMILSVGRSRSARLSLRRSQRIIKNNTSHRRMPSGHPTSGGI